MPRRAWLAPVIFVMAGAVGVWLWQRSVDQSSAQPTQQQKQQAQQQQQSPAAAAPSGAALRANVLPSIPEPTVQGTTVKADQVVVTINGVAISGRQLVAFPASESELEMTSEMFNFLRERAIDRELTFQEARKQGIELTPAQLAELDQVRRNSVERGVSDQAQLDLEVSDARAGIFQASLLAKAAPSPAAPAKGDIATRQKLADEAQAEYGTRLRSYLDELRSAARVE